MLGRSALQKEPSCLEPSRLVELLLSAGHFLFHVLPESARLRNGVSILAIRGIHIHQVRVLGAPTPPKVLDLHDLHVTKSPSARLEVLPKNATMVHIMI